MKKIRQIAFGYRDDTKGASIWCTISRETKTEIDFYVINGGWEGVYDKSKEEVLVLRQGFKIPSRIVWRGCSPFLENDYNESVNWIDDLIATSDYEIPPAVMINEEEDTPKRWQVFFRDISGKITRVRDYEGANEQDAKKYIRELNMSGSYIGFSLGEKYEELSDEIPF
jgi:hypothetical protein